MTTSLGTSDMPRATRAATPGWRDPRLWIGLVIVAASVLAGARLVGQADQSVTVWAVGTDLAAGDTVDTEDLVARRLRFADQADQDLYLLTGEPLPQGRQLLREVAAGEILPRSALGSTDGSGLLIVPLSLPSLSVPPDVAAGSSVDVWVTSEEASGRKVSRPLLRGVTVIAAPSGVDGFGASGERQLVLGVDEVQQRELGKTLAAVGESSITVVGRG